MNYEKISFRPNQQEKEFLIRLNQDFKCKSMTGLMHRLFDEAMKRGLEPNTNDDTIFGDIDFRPASGRQTAPDDDTITLRDTRPTMVQKSAQTVTAINDTLTPKTSPESQNHPLIQLIRDIEEFEKLGRVVHRSFRVNNTS